MKNLPVLRKQSTFFTLSWCAGLSACGTMPLWSGSGCRKPEGSRWSEMHSQPYLRPFFWCAGPSGQSTINFFHGVRAQLFFSLIIRAQFFFSKNFRARLFFSIYTPPPPPPWTSNGHLVNALIKRGHIAMVQGVRRTCLTILIQNGFLLFLDIQALSSFFVFFHKYQSTITHTHTQ